MPYGFIGEHIGRTQYRWVADLKAAGGMHYSVPRTIIPADTNFEWEFELSPSGTTMYIFGDSTSSGTNTARFGLSAGKWFGISFSIVAGLNQTWFSDEKLHRLKIHRDNNELTLLIDGEFDASVNYSGEISFNGLGNKFGGVTSTPTFNGPFFSSKLTVPSNTALNHDYRFDGNDGVLVDYSKSIGSGLFNGYQVGYVDANATYTYYNLTDTSAKTTNWINLTNLKQLLIARKNSTRCVVQFSTDNLTTGLPAVVYNVAPNPLVIDVPVGATHVRIYYSHPSDSNATISIKQADGYGQAVNVTAADRELMTFDSVRTAWVGQELITQQVWENPIGAGYVWSFSDNKWSMIGDGTFSSLDLIPISNLPATALLTGEILDMNGSNQLTVTQEGSQPITSIGSYELLFNLKVHKNYQYKRFGGVMNATISKPSFKRIIEVAQ